ncbi:hypothetical protein Tco_1431455, partial [Tanacetum coccineum]
LSGYPPFGSFTMSLEESDDLTILDVEPVGPVLEAGSLLKFDMHLHRSSLTKIQVKWLVKCYGIPKDLRPRVALEGMTMNALPHDAIGLYAHHFQQGGLRVPFSSFFLKVVEHFFVHISQLVPLGVNRVTFFELYCRSLDIIPTVPIFRVFYKLCKQGNWFSFQNRVGKKCKPCLKDAPTSLKKWKDNFFLVDWRAAPIAMAWRRHDSSVADPFPKSSEYGASDVAKLREVVISQTTSQPSIRCSPFQHLEALVTMVEFLRLPNFKGCRVAACALLPPGTARVTHLASPTERLEDLPLKTGDMVTTEIPCRKVLDDKEKKKRKAEEKAAANVPGTNIQAERVAGNKDAGKEGARKKRRVRIVTLAQPDSEHVSSLIPLNHAKPLETLADEEHVSPTTFADFVTGGEVVQENADATFANEGHGDNEGGLSGLQTQPNPIHHPSRHHETVTPMGILVIYLSLPKGLTDFCCMDNSRLCRDMMSNLFTPADQESFNEGMRNESAIKRSWKLLCQSAQQ